MDPSNGTTAVRVGPEPIDPGAELDRFCAVRQASGAVVSFTGLVRGGADTVLELEHYPGFTEAQIAARAEFLAGTFGLDDLLVVHRVGRMTVGEVVVFVAAAARHRRAAFEGVDAAMDWLKTSAPF